MKGLRQAKMNYSATCKLGLESVVARELRLLGVEPDSVNDARIDFSGDFDTLARANLWLRCAERVLFVAGRFRAETFDALFEGCKVLEWERFIGRDTFIHVKGKSAKSKLFSVSDCQSIVKKAIVDRLCAKYRVNAMPETGKSIIIEVGILNDIVTLALDASGAGLSRRGYRLLSGGAPLAETLGAGIAYLSRHEPEQPLIDPMCGSGTLPIEAAMIALNMAPGLARSFAAEQWPFMSEAHWANAREEARNLRRHISVDILGSDIDAEAVRIARLNAQRAGVDIRFEQRKLQNLETAKTDGVILCNPPYGERLMARREAEALYADMGRTFAKLNGWSVNAISSARDFERYYGRRADKRRNLSNGGLKCTLYQYFKK